MSWNCALKIWNILRVYISRWERNRIIKTNYRSLLNVTLGARVTSGYVTCFHWLKAKLETWKWYENNLLKLHFLFYFLGLVLIILGFKKQEKHRRDSRSSSRQSTTHMLLEHKFGRDPDHEEDRDEKGDVIKYLVIVTQWLEYPISTKLRLYIFSTWPL